MAPGSTRPARCAPPASKRCARPRWWWWPQAAAAGRGWTESQLAALRNAIGSKQHGCHKCLALAQYFPIELPYAFRIGDDCCIFRFEFLKSCNSGKIALRRGGHHFLGGFLDYGAYAIQ
jgi:hypothetical protein